MPLDPEYLKRLVALVLTLAALALLLADPDILNEDWLEDEEAEELLEEEDFPMHMTSRYLDLMPSEQFTIFNLIMENMERNASNFVLDAFVL